RDTGRDLAAGESGARVSRGESRSGESVKVELKCRDDRSAFLVPRSSFGVRRCQERKNERTRNAERGTWNVPYVYSPFNATCGSTRDAFAAGSAHAASETVVRIAVTTMNVAGS